MFQVKFVVCMASYSIGSATESSDLWWLGKFDWTDEFDEAEFFDDKVAAEKCTALHEQVHGVDTRSLSIVQVLWSDCSDETNIG
ncbi:hypothetical protein [Microcoleus sp. D3_18a_C4]|uniref:hypothetical protein n=1 Tax=unclassified Microcoleus TaxID=2642155 RepID=UPI002FD37931